MATNEPLTPRQEAVLDRIRRAGPLGAKATSDLWGPRDGITLRALLRRGLIDHCTGVYTDYYRLALRPPTPTTATPRQERT